MSDSLRKPISEQIEEKVTPDSQKSTTDKVTEKGSGLGDKALGGIQSDDSKSTTQKAADSTRSGADDAQNKGSGVLGSVTDTASNTLNAAGESINNATSSLTGNK